MTIPVKSTKRNKRIKIRRDVKEVRSQRELLYNYRDERGVILSPKQTLESLRRRKTQLYESLSCEYSEHLMNEKETISKEIEICEAFLKKEAKRHARRRSDESNIMKKRFNETMRNVPLLLFHEKLMVLQLLTDCIDKEEEESELRGVRPNNVRIQEEEPYVDDEDMDDHDDLDAEGDGGGGNEDVVEGLMSSVIPSFLKSVWSRK
jgi:hypothetical protein